MNLDNNFFSKKGYLVIRSAFIQKIKLDVENEIINILKTILKLKGLNFYEKNISYANLIKYSFKHDKYYGIFSSLYDLLPASTAINTLGSNKFFITIAKKLGLIQPIIGSLPQVRIDRPHDKTRQTLLHQDFWYSFLSNNSITIWFSVGSQNKQSGPLKIFPNTHINGVYKFKNKKKGTFSAIVNENKLKAKKITLKDNEILIFNQKLLHKSGDNLSNIPRISVQIRYNDLKTLVEPASSFRSITSNFVKLKQKKFLIK